MAALLGGCAHLQPSAPPASGAELVHTPFFPQSAYQCGPAALATVLVDSGVSTEPDALVDKVWIAERKGSLQAELLAATRSFARLPLRLEPTLDHLSGSLQAGYPVLILLNLGVRWLPVWHYAVVIGETETGWVLRSGTTRRHWMSRADLSQAWERAERWAFVVAQPAHMPPMASLEPWVRAADDLINTGQPEAGLLALRQAAHRWPDSRLTWFALGNAQAAQGDWSAAQASFQQSVALDGDWLPAINNLVSALLELGCPARADPFVARLKRSAADYAKRTVADYQSAPSATHCQLAP